MVRWGLCRRAACFVVISMAITILSPGWSKSGWALADQPSGQTGEKEAERSEPPGGKPAYHTPLAGEPVQMLFMGEAVDIPRRDRGNVSDLTLGGTFYSPKQGNTVGIPFFALYLKRMWEEARLRAVLSIFVNEVEADKSFGNVELVGLLQNYTVPFAQTEVVDNKEIKESSQIWGTIFAFLGPGLRYPVAPFQIDNDLRLQLLGRVGYFYAQRTGDTDPNTVLPPDTMLYGGKLRGRYDGMRRNLLELPHSGIAAGFDLDYVYRDKWSDFGTPPFGTFTKSDTRQYLQFSGYIMGAAGIPGLSEKNRVFVSVHGGTTDPKSVDRYNAFRIGGGPLPYETDDLYRPDYPGTRFNVISVSNYALTAVEYRRELNFFMYLHLRGSFIWADQADVTGLNQGGFKKSNGQAATIGLDSGFFWDSSIYLEYSWDSGFIRNGRAGSGLLVMWNKSF